MLCSIFTVLLLAGGIASAHKPGHDHSHEQAVRRRFLDIHTNTLNHCSSKHVASGLYQRAVNRRDLRARSLMASSSSHAVKARQTSSLGESHKSDKPYNASTDPKEVFSGNNACVLNPETTEGPFYVLGQDIRTDLVETQQGVPLYLDFQLIDVETCEPIEGAFIEMWNANSTGVYSGALAVVNGIGMSDVANLERNFLRGAQQTDEDGAVQFRTLFPGHYEGRAPHIHVVSHFNATARANNTIWDSRVTHAGQVFFDQDVVDAVKQLPPYSTNTQNLMRNADDAILLQEAATSDPFFQYVLLGDSLADGIFAWFSFGVNTSFTRDIMAAAMRFEQGNEMVTTNPKIPGLDQLFPGGFPTAYQPGFGGAAAPAAPTGNAEAGEN
ncbi:Intradiol ring-cleavage dioxygenase [Corynascus similis CBS 632.67]